MRTPLLSIIFVAVILVSSTLANTSLSINNSAFIPLKIGRWFDYVVVIMMENHSINNTYGMSVPPNSWNSNSQTCLGNCTYYNLLANSNGFAEEYTSDIIGGCSLGCYVAITSGYGNTSQPCNGGPSGGCLLQIPNIVDRLESAHLSWKAYMEDYPISSGCYNAFKGNYEPNHNPFIYYSDIQNNPARCSHIVNANRTVLAQNSTGCWPTAVQNDDLFINDLNSVSTASNYTFLTPNRVDDNHDCNDVTVGNAWLNKIIPQILGSAVFTNKRAALFITFDEPGCTNPPGPPPQPLCPPPISELYSVWASNPAHATTKTSFKSVNPYTHYNALRTIEDNWNLPPFISSTDGSAQNMKEFFPFP
jgi:hypothetical protein